MFSQLTLHVLVALSLLSSTLALPAPAPKATHVVRKNTVTLPFVRHYNLTGTNLLKSDQARAKYLKTKHLSKGSSFSEKSAKAAAASIGVGITNAAVTYTVDVTVGSPPQPFSLIVDTGSSNTWVGADPNNPFIPGPGSQDTGDEVFVEYGSGLFIGEEFIDTITFGDITIPQQSFGAAEFAIGFDGVDGILGLGPLDLTEGTTSSGGDIPTVTDNAFDLGLIDSKVLGISFAPPTSLSDANGQLTFGGVDSDLFTGPLTTVPITSTFPASEFVGIDQTVSYAGSSILASSGIVDTGTTLLLIASDALAAYASATGAEINNNVGLLQITPDQLSNLQSLFFTIGGTTFEFTPNAQLWPRALNEAIGGEPDDIFLIVGDIGTPSGEGFDFVNGMTFLERFYTTFDAANSEFSIANAPWSADADN